MSPISDNNIPPLSNILVGGKGKEDVNANRTINLKKKILKYRQA